MEREEIRQLIIDVVTDSNKLTESVDKIFKHIKDSDNTLKTIEEIEFDLHSQGCGLEDQNITDRYAAMEYGFNSAMDKVNYIINDQ